MTDFLGREHELRLLLDRINAARGGMVLVTGPPRVGKQELLRQLWVQLADEGRHQLVPDPADDEFIRIDPSTEVEEFRRTIQAESMVRPGDFCASQVLGIYGYQPSRAFDTWFTSTYLPTLGRRGIRRKKSDRAAAAVDPVGFDTEDRGDPNQVPVPTTVILAGFDQDIQHLRSLAAGEPIVLAPLDPQIVQDHLAAETAGLREPLTAAELRAYAELVSEDAGTLNQLLHVLDLDETRDPR